MHIDFQETGQALDHRQKRFVGFFSGFVIAGWALLTIAVPAAGVVVPVLFILALSRTM